jgi:hypothetical protein
MEPRFRMVQNVNHIIPEFTLLLFSFHQNEGRDL